MEIVLIETNSKKKNYRRKLDLNYNHPHGKIGALTGYATELTRISCFFTYLIE
jgi:hypothetical protein